MKKTIQKEEVPEFTMNPLVGGAIGAVVGAVVGTVVTQTLSNHDSQTKMGKILGNIADTAIGTLKDANTKADGLQTIAKETIEQGIDKVGRKFLNN